MEYSGSWCNNKMPLQRLAGVGRLVGSQGRTPTITGPVARCQSDNQEDDNMNKERGKPPKQMTLMVMRGFNGEIETNKSGRNIALENDETGVRSQHRLLSTTSTTMTILAQFPHSYKNVKIAGVDAATN